MIAIFGGTFEGRSLAEACDSLGIQAVYICATDQGAERVRGLKRVTPLVGRMEASQMEEALAFAHADQVFDATHPYAVAASENIETACESLSLSLSRISREALWSGDTFADLPSAVSWLETEPGNIFATVGASGAKALSALNDFNNRVWLRILPSMDSLSHCLGLGYRSNRLMLMEGPFAASLNKAMFTHANAQILLTKESGSAGGFLQKIEAAKMLGMKVAVIKRPETKGAVSLEEAIFALNKKRFLR
jgi:precorrin-6x reductase